MDTLRDALDKRREQLKTQTNNGKRPINKTWEEATEFAQYVGLSTPFVLRLIKIYGPGRVFGLRSWLKDAPHDPARYAGLVVWKLKEVMKSERSNTNQTSGSRSEGASKSL